MKNGSLIALLAVFMTLVTAACGSSDKADSQGVSGSSDILTDESSQAQLYEELNIKSNEELLANEKNIAGNGFIIINDEADYPEYLNDFRYDCGGRVLDFWGNEVFSVEQNDLFFNCGLSPHKFENGLYGYIDLNGETVIEPIYSSALYFVNGSAQVTTEDETFFIDLNDNKTDDTMYNGYNGSFDRHDFYGAFTGKYLVYQDALEDIIAIGYGYSDADGNDTPMDNAKTAFSFVNGYAFVEAGNGEEYYFIDEDFNRVTDFSQTEGIRITPKTIVNLINEQYFLIGIEYVLQDGYFVVNTGTASEPDFVLAKICPELYKAE